MALPPSGVLTSITSQLVPSPKVLNLDLLLAAGAESTSAFDWITDFVRSFPSLADQGVAGYPIIFNSVPNFLGGGSEQITGIKARFVMTDAAHETDLVDIVRPMLTNITNNHPDTYAFTSLSHFPDWNSWFKKNYDTSPTGHNKVIGSWLLRQAFFNRERDRIASCTTRILRWRRSGPLPRFWQGRA